MFDRTSPTIRAPLLPLRVLHHSSTLTLVIYFGSWLLQLVNQTCSLQCTTQLEPTNPSSPFIHLPSQSEATFNCESYGLPGAYTWTDTTITTQQSRQQATSCATRWPTTNKRHAHYVTPTINTASIRSIIWDEFRPWTKSLTTGS
jgi:hypothetical protein